MNDEQFFQFCQLNRDLCIERAANGDMIIMPPEGGSIGRGCVELTSLFQEWEERHGTGKIFGSSTGFTLPNGATRAPDVAWVKRARLDALTDEEWEKFLPLCPDFVLELRSRTDSLRVLREKMEEYLANGARLGWLLDPPARQALIYRSGRPVEVVAEPGKLSGEDVLPGFELDAPALWRAMERPRS